MPTNPRKRRNVTSRANRSWNLRRLNSNPAPSPALENCAMPDRYTAPTAKLPSLALLDARNDDRRVSTTHWLYMSLRGLGRDAEAREALAPINGDLHVFEADAYFRLGKLYNGLPTGESSAVVHSIVRLRRPETSGPDVLFAERTSGTVSRFGEPAQTEPHPDFASLLPPLSATRHTHFPASVCGKQRTMSPSARRHFSETAYSVREKCVRSGSHRQRFIMRESCQRASSVFRVCMRQAISARVTRAQLLPHRASHLQRAAQRARGRRGQPFLRLLVDGPHRRTPQRARRLLHQVS